MKIGSRDSKLAICQAQEVINKLGVPCELVTMKTTGDMILNKTLDKVGGKGLFVKELDRALINGEVDLTVHSLKDVPMEQPDGFPLIAYTKREDARDVLILPDGIKELDESKPIGCSSARRKVQLEKLFPNAIIMPIRGNIQTRLKKLDSGEYGALVLAAAGIHRLGLTHRISRYFSCKEILPAAGQGILAVQGNEHFDRAFLDNVNDKESQVCAIAERSYVCKLNGGCFAPIAAYANVDGDNLTLKVMYENDGKLIYITKIGNKDDAKKIGIDAANEIILEVNRNCKKGV